MNASLSKSVRMVAAGVLVLSVGAGLVLPGTASAQEHREFHGPYRTPHMVFDDRYHHGHYYPAIGYSVSVLPPGYLSVGYGSRHFFFHGGVWYAPGPAGFLVVAPPVGVVVPVLPPAYATLWISGVPYYYANSVYYAQGPGGYMVVAPPPGAESYVEQPQVAPPQQYAQPQPQYGAPPGQYSPPPGQYTPPGPQAGASAPPPGGDKWYYCDSAKGYYPYVPECKEGWRAVPAAPPPH